MFGAWRTSGRQSALEVKSKGIQFRLSGETDQRVSRRGLLRGGGALVGAAALLGRATVVRSAETLTLDVACDGFTYAMNRSSPAGPNDPERRGDTFIVEGKIYPGGTIEEGLSGPSQAGSIGTWVCRGWYYYDLADIFEGAAPHVVTTQLYLLDNGDALASDGMEGGMLAKRTVTGGHGTFNGVGGQVSQEEMDTNDTLVTLGDGTTVSAPNFRFVFALT